MTRFANHQLEQVKRFSVRKLAEDAGVVLKGRGAELRGLCPFHEDRAPSLVVNTEKNVWSCLGACRKGGSPIDWVMAAQSVTFVEAVKWLLPKVGGDARAGAGPVERPLPAKRESPVAVDADRRTALNQVGDYYWQTLKGSQTAQAYLTARGLGSAELVDHFKLGLLGPDARALAAAARSSSPARRCAARSIELGVLKATGHELFCGRLVVPVTDEAGDVVWMYGRMVGKRQRDGVQDHLNMPGPKRGVFNVAALTGRTVILCEAAIDALTFWVHGHRNVTCTFGVGGLTAEHLEVFRKNGTQEVLIAFDRDKAGNAGVVEVAEQLQEEGMDCHRVELPAGFDVNLYAQRFPENVGVMLGAMLRQATLDREGEAEGAAAAGGGAGGVCRRRWRRGSRRRRRRSRAPAVGSIQEALLSLAADLPRPAGGGGGCRRLAPGLPGCRRLPRPPAAAESPPLRCRRARCRRRPPRRSARLTRPFPPWLPTSRGRRSPRRLSPPRAGEPGAGGGAPPPLRCRRARCRRRPGPRRWARLEALPSLAADLPRPPVAEAAVAASAPASPVPPAPQPPELDGGGEGRRAPRRRSAIGATACAGSRRTSRTSSSGHDALHPRRRSEIRRR